MPGEPQDLRPYFEATHPTPKPTTEEWADKVLADRDAKVRAKAFEEAAEALDVESKRFATGSVRRLDYKRAAILVRALAKVKEQADE